MKITMLAALSLMSGINAWGVQDHGDPARKIVVDVTNSIVAPGAVLYQAEVTAQQILASADVQIEFRNGVSRQIQAGPIRSLIVTMGLGTPPNCKPGALAYALPYEGTHITVFYDRVRSIQTGSTARILGHVLAHEITHMLKGVCNHSVTGLMKCHWDKADYFVMLSGNLPLTAGDIEEIHCGMKGQSQTGNLNPALVR